MPAECATTRRSSVANVGAGHRHPLRRIFVGLWFLVGIGTLAVVDTAAGETWRGLTVAPEHRCSPYDKKRDYPYPQSVEREIVRELGAVVWALHGDVLQLDQADRHRAHRGCERGARLGALRSGPRNQGAVRAGRPKPHARLPHR